ncbi:PilT/PilU family type 4a pilus ATPase [Myxococcota bacterium]|nr:PilT/PilU family type 4a pilus ATPase [Myxococcota bacterium]
MGANRGPALQALARLLEDPDEALAVAAVQAFAGMADEDQWFEHLPAALESRRPAVVRAAVSSLGAFRSPRAIATLQSKLRTGNKAVRVVVLDTLEAIGTDAVLPALVDALSHKSLAVRSRATEVLGNLGAQGKVEIARTVIWLLRSPDPDVRRLAVDIARRAKDPNETLWPRLFELLRDQDWWVRERVADALVELAGRRLIPHLAGFLEDPAPPVRLFAVDVLTRMKATEALGALVRAAQKDADWWVRERAMEAIATLGDARAAPYLLHIVLTEPKVRLGGLAALARLGAREVAPRLAPLLQEEDPDVRLATLRALEVLGDASLAPLLLPLATDPRVEVRELARRLAAGWQLELAVAGGDAIAGTPLDHLLVRTAQAHGDDLLLSPGRKPFVRRMNAVEPLADEVLDDEAVRALVLPILHPAQLAALAAREDVDLSYEVASHRLRFRANVFHQMHGLSAVFRIIKGAIPSLSTLGLPPVVARLGRLKNGLVLVGGPTGSGKSTTLAALIDDINQSSARHVITLEDPIEAVHGNRQGLVNQREVGTHTRSYPMALRATLREDPDVILVGELRDLDTIAFAVSAAETGHLVFGTVHTVSADTTLDRIINVFPSTQQDQVRSMLAGSLRAVVCQYLLPRAQGEGRVLACEVMLNNDAVANLIRTGKTFQLPSVIATQRAAGMQLMDGELLRLVREGTVGAEVAWVKARDRREFEALLGGPPTDRGPLGGS